MGTFWDICYLWTVETIVVMSVTIRHQPLRSFLHYQVDEGITMNSSTDALTHRFLALHLSLNVQTAACKLVPLVPACFILLLAYISLSNLGPFNITDLSPFVSQLVPSVLQASCCFNRFSKFFVVKRSHFP